LNKGKAATVSTDGGVDADALPDLTDLNLIEFLGDINPVLASIMKRVAKNDDDSSGIVAGFQSAI
jgi:hypothetical protein